MWWYSRLSVVSSFLIHKNMLCRASWLLLLLKTKTHIYYRKQWSRLSCCCTTIPPSWIPAKHLVLHLEAHIRHFTVSYFEKTLLTPSSGVTIRIPDWKLLRLTTRANTLTPRRVLASAHCFSDFRIYFWISFLGLKVFLSFVSTCLWVKCAEFIKLCEEGHFLIAPRLFRPCILFRSCEI